MKLEFGDLPPLQEPCYSCWQGDPCPQCGNGRIVPTDFGQAVLDLVARHLYARLGDGKLKQKQNPEGK